jgi:hypothetical protein
MFDWFKDPPIVKTAVDVVTTLKSGRIYRKSVVRSFPEGFSSAMWVMRRYLESGPTIIEVSINYYVPVHEIADISLEDKGVVK